MSKLIKGPHLETVTNNFGHPLLSILSMLFWLPEQVIYVERNSIAQLHVKLKLFVSGRRSISYTTFEAWPLESMIGHDNNDANPGYGRTTDRNATLCYVILQTAGISLRYVRTRFHKLGT
ncbi:hypothetical protein Hanom_Chr17g01560701 [Helianthus anomalus]